MQKLGKIVDFFGADPMVELNSEIYSRIGKYFPFAVARHAGFSNASIQKNGKKLFSVGSDFLKFQVNI